ncbi:hypothetical protein ACE1CI_11340 [Aerosakkonemataceae cyanobacterium BLCC-F50]|uniref:Uncharacterized protein n=1 Tax=Floridaenema flaviceps BLCC-F50 TaxID=3153642 RepID=A0ABV4XP69_9CYAN
MNFVRIQKILAPFLLGLLLLVSSCAKQAPSRYEQAQNASTGRNATPAVVKVSTQGSLFNKYFPKSGDGYQVVPAQEKKGFAEYKLKKDGKDVAVLSVSDTVNNPSAKEKFQSSGKKIAGYPAANIGSNGTAVLVADRYQVKVQSRDSSFSQSDREAWLQKFNLRGIAALK